VLECKQQNTDFNWHLCHLKNKHIREPQKFTFCISF